jgi:uncharacterized circularly permuted ATP-grasp superfamily protein/uncharacterized alpha-E superfamily protein
MNFADAVGSATSSLVAGYQPAAGVTDELLSAPGVMRAHWAPMMQRAQAIGAEGLNERRETARQLLAEHGVTYNAYADGRSAVRTWQLDTLPLLIAPDEWARLATGLAQRTRLLNLVLADIYGPQRLLREGVLPPALLQANPGFLRPCHGIRPPGGCFLSLHAVDLARAPSGQWWVLADRTQAPSGVGYALENRIITSRVLADEFRQSNVERAASFFVERKASLRSMAPWTDSPNIVLLTPGPLAETYFEHVYLARYLGYPLVEGNDLTVRDRRVFLRTIDGLQPVDVIIRRVDDTFCDPLELRADSFLGVPGLIEAARAGNVALSNALGSGAVEAPALLAFLPALAKHLLGEDLHIPNVATWWCGQDRERAYTLNHLHTLVVKRGFVARQGGPHFASDLSPRARAELAERIKARPHAFVGQEVVPLSTAPVWTGERLEPRPIVLRCYITATAGGYSVMPGGLTRFSASPTSPIVSSQVGGGSKDTWVLSERPVEEITLLPAAGAAGRAYQGHTSVSSRVVENLFWLGRYAERLEGTTRLQRVVLGRLAGEGGPVEEAELAAVLDCLVKIEKLPVECAGRIPLSKLIPHLQGWIFDGEQTGSLREILDRIASLTASVRDRLSADTWRILNHLQGELSAPPTQFNAGQIQANLHRVIFHLAAFSGMEMENMTRGDAWRFLDIGRRIERANNLAAMVRGVVAVDPTGGVALGPLLEYSDSTMTYRRRYLARPELPTTLTLLLRERTNPRSLAFQVESLRKHLTRLPGLTADLPERQHFAELNTLVLNTDFAALDSTALDKLLDTFIDGCWALSDFLAQRFFRHVVPRAH